MTREVQKCKEIQTWATCIYDYLSWLKDKLCQVHENLQKIGFHIMIHTSITFVIINNYYFLSTMIFEHPKIVELSYIVQWDGEILLSLL